jgi:DNA-nicking Smr family endonuclease
MLPAMGKRHTDAELESDAELWARVAKSARPLKKGRAVAPIEPTKKRAKPAAKKAPPPPKPAPNTPAKPAPTVRGETLDRQTARKLERGHVAVEAKLDLHGMRQREAHAALRRFLKAAQGKGYRHVLVITGKGAAADTRRSFYEAEERGVLRSAVPHWLAQPDLAPVVVSYSEAPRRLGGEGALYVRLRRSKRAGEP